ncbi:MAG: primosomal protein N' [Oscillospiraceae bacterium]|nr:primosomal protein N' [Oscillospiraceae bacterium]
MRVAKLALSAAIYAIDRPYFYRIPPDLEQQVLPGMRVLAPFGAGNRHIDGIVLAVEMETVQPERPLKTILSLLDDEPVLSQEGIRLALWMREQYFCTVYQAARAMLPAGLWFSLLDIWRVAEGVDRQQAYQAAGRSSSAHKLLDILYANHGELEIGRIKAAFGAQNPNPALKLLKSQGVLSLETSAARGVGDKTERVVCLAVSPEEALAAVRPRRKQAPLQYAVVELLSGVGRVSSKEVCYFTGASPATLRALEKKGLVCQEKRKIWRRPASGQVKPAQPVCLNQEQQQAADGMLRLMERGEAAVALLYGVTGSGKTQVYLTLISHVLKKGKSAMLLVPEIALTPQLLRIFTSYFGDQVAILHSNLRSGERYDEWKRIQSGRATVVLGTRSAVFAPLGKLGLIILDEEQEHSYKSETVPRYHTREVAKYRCVQTGALLVLGSATPSVESMYQAEQGTYHLFTLRERFNEQALPQVLIADMREELQRGNGSDLSGLLRRELGENLSRGEQSILLLNRRGASRMLVCGECGQAPACPRCSVYLTYHSANRRLMCHYCGHSEPLPERCPACGGQLAYVGTGTQKVQQQLEACFPGTQVLRMDADTISASNSHDKLLARFQKEKIPILVGTQMVAKGLDFENVTLVGVLAADLSLYADDFRAGERTFSLITQAVGLPCRGNKQGRAVIQTMTPGNEVITCAAEQDYDRFYHQEIILRQLRACAPFRDQFRLTASGAEEHAVLRACLRLRQSLEQALEEECYRGMGLEVLGPAPASVAKVNNQYRYRLSIMGKNSRQLRQLLAHLLRAAQQDRENAGVAIYGDLNPLS